MGNTSGLEERRRDEGGEWMGRAQAIDHCLFDDGSLEPHEIHQERLVHRAEDELRFVLCDEGPRFRVGSATGFGRKHATGERREVEEGHGDRCRPQVAVVAPEYQAMQAAGAVLVAGAQRGIGPRRGARTVLTTCAHGYQQRQHRGDRKRATRVRHSSKRDHGGPGFVALIGQRYSVSEAGRVVASSLTIRMPSRVNAIPSYCPCFSGSGTALTTSPRDVISISAFSCAATRT